MWRYQCSKAVMLETERREWVWEVFRRLRSEELEVLEDGLNTGSGMMREKDLPGKAARFLAWVQWVELYFAKYLPCNTSSTGYVMVLHQKWLYPQISLWNVNLNKTKPELSAAGLLRAFNMLQPLLIIITITVKHLQKFYLVCVLWAIWKEPKFLRKLS